VAQLAVRWAIDFCSWDEDNPSRRDVALRRYLHQATAIRGWSGSGRQRATFAVAGAVWIDEIDPDVAWVDVETLVTPYEPRPVRAISDASGKPSGESQRSRPSAAPAPEPSGWRALDSAWMQVIAAVRRLPAGSFVIDPDIDPALLDELDAPADGPDLSITDQAL
jgi:hypothetical protein